ncbi:hypothetical protein [Phnomibacter ginsenosidimutans]|uniref:Uncharacterized protein n=1 Tax=Phnomibacter ginsenosidimutans TaxID=2676868 RepID=A0A6I6H6G7_9BACT|nr:hypothetical protein [Phnomibacter ginsenosidimutans]QGW29911.1 hypothetical protein GLV81_18905 [Phnomibacter ginsenosidimutans]
MKKWMWTGGLLLLLACSEQPAKPVETKKKLRVPKPQTMRVSNSFSTAVPAAIW